MSGADYWRKRAEARMDQALQDGEAALKTISQAHKRALWDLQEAVARIKRRMGKLYGLGPDEVKALLDAPCGRGEYLALLEQIKQMPPGAARKALEARAASGAYAFRVSRLEALQDNVQAVTARLAATEEDATRAGLEQVVKETHARTVYDIQRETGAGFPFAEMNTQAVRAILKEPWSGASFSKRIWHNQKMMGEKLNETLTAGFMSGRANTKIARDIAEDMGVSFRAAERLVRTETCYMANAAEMQSYADCGIDRYEFLATLDMRTSKVCQALDGSVHYVKDAEPGKNMPPMHPHCRSTTVAVTDDQARLAQERMARDPVTGETVKVPRTMTYPEWRRMQEEHYGKERIDAARKMAENKASDRKQYDRYKDLLGKENAPETFAKFQQMKYTDLKEWTALKAYGKNIRGGELSPLSGFENYKQTIEEANNSLVGVKTGDGLKITGYSDHFINRTIGSVEQRRNGVSIAETVSTLRDPDRVVDGPMTQAGRSKRYISKRATVSVNPDTGVVIQVNPMHSKEEKT